MHFESFFRSFKSKSILGGQTKLEDYFDSSKLAETHEFFLNKQQKVLVNLESELRKNFGLITYVY